MKMYTHGKITGSAKGWARLIWIDVRTFYGRVLNHGESSDAVYKPVDKAAQAKAVKRHLEKKERRRFDEKILHGLQPRRDINSLPSPGTWEKENITGEAQFYHGGSKASVVEHSGDHYMGRTC